MTTLDDCVRYAELHNPKIAKKAKQELGLIRTALNEKDIPISASNMLWAGVGIITGVVFGTWL